ncbi:MAG: hypothetical protein H7125_16185, partial [Proteobacteria bacterium]|nr:hypothetical protein [Burkholderiales bacterium]
MKLSILNAGRPAACDAAVFLRARGARRGAHATHGGTLVVLSVVLTLCGCGTLPDARKLADASAQLSSAVAASGAGVAAELDGAGQVERAAELRKAWQVPEHSSAALARYADALASI